MLFPSRLFDDGVRFVRARRDVSVVVLLIDDDEEVCDNWVAPLRWVAVV